MWKIVQKYFEVGIRDPETDQKKNGEVGEIMVKSLVPYGFMQGYLGLRRSLLILIVIFLVFILGCWYKKVLVILFLLIELKIVLEKEEKIFLLMRLNKLLKIPEVTGKLQHMLYQQKVVMEWRMM